MKGSSSAAAPPRESGVGTESDLVARESGRRGHDRIRWRSLQFSVLGRENSKNK